MLNNYRRRFVILNMLLVGLVLLGTFIMIGTVERTNSYNELKNTMTLVLKPWNSSKEKQPPRPNNHGEKNDDTKSPPEKSANEPKVQEKRYKDDNITTIMYNSRNDDISVLSETLSFDGDVSRIVPEIASQKDSFGTLYEYHIIYYSEKTQNEYKIAVADISYIGYRMVRITVILLFAYILSMALVFFISLKLSKLAAKPMENAIEMERKFVADISHDLKTPITVILANNSIIKSNPNTTVSENQQWLDSTDNAADEMMNLINKMLTLSSLESVEKTVEKQAVSLSSIAEKCILQMESVAYERGITVEDEISENITILSNDEYTKRICNSLIENALKYEPDGGNIKIQVCTSRKKALFSVQNLGSIINEDDLPHIFDRFYRGDKTRNLSKGHGLGLPIVHKMCELINAHIMVKSTKKDGTIFTVEFEIF